LNNLRTAIFNISNYQELALQVFRYQYEHNRLYREYVDLLGVNPQLVNRLEAIPFLPIRFFKSHAVICGDALPAQWFESSGTTGMTNSRHYVADMQLYRESFQQGFRKFYEDPSGYAIIGLLPSYLERQHSSLVMMVDELIQQSAVKESGFYLYEHGRLKDTLQQLESRQQKTLLIGVTFALLDFAEASPMPLNHTILMETGGMKGRREEMTRDQVHAVLTNAFQVPTIHSEYGMTELLSQGYSDGRGIFKPADTMRILLRDDDDPMEVCAAGETPRRGIINVIDLANLDSCAFIATEDAGVLYPDGSFEVTGRVDHSDIRGCSLMVV
jgi:phenylacetate-coenzyme A ligase PaaK-like adenylate-forming protein